MKPIFLIVGRTASGKDTLTQEICNKLDMKQLISWTTRPPRTAAESTHKFGTRNDFDMHCAANNVVASTEINGNLYWATKTDLDACDFYIIDPLGLEKLKSNYPNMNFVTIYIYAPAEERRKRFLMRQPGQVDLWFSRNTSENAQFQLFENCHKYDHIIVNDRFETAIWKLSCIIDQETHKK